MEEPEEIPPPTPSVDEETFPLPRPSADDEEMIVVSIPPRPPGLLRRLFDFIGGPHYKRCSPHGTEVPLSIETQNFSAGGEIPAPDRWWTSFGDTALDRQIETSLGGSLTLRAALQRLRASRALARREASDLLPDLNGVGDAGGTILTYAPNGSLFTLGLNASYQVDLWGQIGSR
ncbi:MAG: hypothetical protein DWQ35_03060, partial [Planctomycetota bacterium]